MRISWVLAVISLAAPASVVLVAPGEVAAGNEDCLGATPAGGTT